ncbi:hypothetical protein [Carboxylicivirga sp. RSCT41]|uniref:hypothetical protein n=1 Tax=Carboxylicivirga agarovorans TaxID=3417570 RepID=UPI003D348698
MNLKAIAICCFLALYCLILKAEKANGKNLEAFLRDTTSLEVDTSANVPVFFGAEPELVDTTATVALEPAPQNQAVTDTIQPKQESSTTVIKGYSPFTNYTDTFVVATPTSDTTSPKVNLRLQRAIANLNATTNDQATDNFIHENNIGYSKTSLTQLWYNYINASYTSNTSTNEQDLIAENTSTEANKLVVKQNPELLQATNTKSSDYPPVTSNNTPVVKTRASVNNTSIESDVVFYIQIAAARSELSSSEIDLVNKTQAEYRITNENGWYKYQVPIGSDYISARQTINEYPGKQAFLVAYKSDQRLNLWETVKHIELKTAKRDELLFVVQVAASRDLLSEKEKNQLLLPGDNLRIITEDGWHKYQIIVGPSYQLALSKCKVIGISKSFPVAYLNGEKIDMAKAIKMTITNN